jgi:outer membrane lipoprotein-sorting protein
MPGPRILVALALLALLALAGAADGGETARQILDRRKALDDTSRRWDDRQQRMTLRLFDRRGGERVREVEIFERREPGDEQKTILFFLAPAEVRGTAFLAHVHPGRPADQWLYLPELKRIRKITAQTRRESFVGTDLSYQDLDLIQEMTSWSEADAASRLRGEESVGGVPAHVIELARRRPDIPYPRIVLWLGRDDLVPRRLEFWDDGGDQPRKRIEQAEVRLVGRIPVAHRVEVTTPGAATRTEITITDVRFDQKLEDELFEQRALERGRR